MHLLIFVFLAQLGLSGCHERDQNAECHSIKDRETCLKSLETRNFVANGVSIYQNRCVWCQNGPCTGNNQNRCEPKDWLDTQKHSGYEECADTSDEVEETKLETVSSHEGSWIKVESHMCQYHGYKPIAHGYRCMAAIEASTKKGALDKIDNSHSGPTGCRRDGKMPNANAKHFFVWEEQKNLKHCTKAKECYCQTVPVSKDVHDVTVALLDEEEKCRRVLEDYLYSTTSKSTGPEKCDCYTKHLSPEKRSEYGLNKYCEVKCENCVDGCIHQGTCYSRRNYEANKFACVVAVGGQWCSANTSTETMSFMVALALDNPMMSLFGMLGFSVVAYATFKKILQKKEYDTIL